MAEGFVLVAQAQEAEGPPTWVYFLAPLATVLTTIIGFAVFYFLGVAQMKAQVRHEKAAEALVEILRVVDRLSSELGIWSLYHERDDLELKHAKEITRLRGELQSLVYDNSPWFEPETEGKVRPILKALPDVSKEHRASLKAKNVEQAKKTGDRLYQWSVNELVDMRNALEDESRRLIGTKRK